MWWWQPSYLTYEGGGLPEIRKIMVKIESGMSAVGNVRLEGLGSIGNLFGIMSVGKDIAK
jgi:hypothetical protein